MRAPHWIALGLLVVAMVAFVRVMIERQESAVLRSEIAVLQQESQRVAQLRAERERLMAGKVSDAELQRLRSDRAALIRLRNEINTLEANADRMAQQGARESAQEKPAQLMKLSFGSDGGLLLDDAPLDQAALRQHLARFAGNSERVEISLRLGVDKTSIEAIKPTVEAITRYGKELGLKFTMRFEKGAR